MTQGYPTMAPPAMSARPALEGRHPLDRLDEVTKNLEMAVDRLETRLNNMIPQVPTSSENLLRSRDEIRSGSAFRVQIDCLADRLVQLNRRLSTVVDSIDL